MERRDRRNSATEIENHTLTDAHNFLLATSIRGQIQSLPPLSSECCIYRVPHQLRSVNEKAYTPQIVSIGPLHYGKKDLVAMEEYKLRYMVAFLNHNQMSLENCIEVIREREQRARNCYVERIELSSDDFVKLLLVDSCFILEVMMRRFCSNLGRITDDYLSKLPEVFRMKVDMLLLENQLPFFILETLFKLAYPTSEHRGFLEICISNICHLLLLKGDNTHLVDHVMGRIESGFEVKHFVDLSRICHLRISPNLTAADRGTFVAIRNTTELVEAGMNFKMGSSNNALDVRYATGVLEIPCVSISDDTEVILRNLIALELCHYPFDERYISDYIAFMDGLMDTGKDVDLLIRNGIIENWMSDSFAVAALFNNLAINVMVSSKYTYHRISINLNSYCAVRCHKWKATFKRNYLSTPWRIASTTAAVILLVLTFIQTICSIISLL